MHALVAGRDDAAAALRRVASSQVVTMPPAPAMIGMSGDDVVGLELGFDDEIDMARRQHAVGVAVAAVAREPHRVLDLAEGRAVLRFISSGLVVNSTRLGRGSRTRARADRARRPDRGSDAAPPSPEKRSRVKGWFIMPKTGSPNRISAISVPQAGMPEMKDLVPSIGSSTQTYSASVRSAPNSSPTMPWCGELLADERAHACSAARSAAVTGSNPPAFCSRRQRGAEERQDRLARDGGELVDEAAKSMAVTPLRPFHFRIGTPEGVLSGGSYALLA